jgi:parvulin-like peptidyl-prolyl isomerase
MKKAFFLKKIFRKEKAKKALFLFILGFFCQALAQTEDLETPQSFSMKRPEKIYYRQLLISFQGCVGDTSNRSRLSAEELIQNIYNRLIERHKKREPYRFEEECFQYSEHPSRLEGGLMPYFHVGSQLPEIEIALLRCPMNQIIRLLDPTPYGFHLLQRLGPQRLYFSEILITSQDSKLLPSKRSSRTRLEALQRVQTVLEKLEKKECTFEEAVLRYGDPCISQKQKGYVGSALVEVLPAPLRQALLPLGLEEISKTPIETSLGFHIVKRHQLQRVRLSHLLFEHTGVQKPFGTPSLDQETARKVAISTYQKLLQGELSFEELAKNNTDGSREKAGDLGYYHRQDRFFFSYSPFELEVGEISPPVESPSGIHLLKRME